jgi:hypothetical protein
MGLIEMCGVNGGREERKAEPLKEKGGKNWGEDRRGGQDSGGNYARRRETSWKWKGTDSGPRGMWIAFMAIGPTLLFHLRAPLAIYFFIFSSFFLSF